MKILFVASGNKKVGTVSSFVQSQYDSLVAEGLDMRLFPVVGHGIKGYMKNVRSLRHLIRTWRPDVVHSHYSTFGILSTMAMLCMFHKPKTLVSILGSFPMHNFKWHYVRFFIQHIWNGTLTKSKRTADQLGFDLPVVPNGVNLDVFHPTKQTDSRKQVGFDENKKYIIWCSNPERPEKNFVLAEEAVKQLSFSSAVELVSVFNRTPQDVAKYMNAADCLLLTSWSEGSPNVIKEAMACDCPIVTTDVGDVVERLNGLDGCCVYQTEHNITNLETQFKYHEEAACKIAALIRNALDFGQRTKGYERIITDGLTVELTAKKIIDIYMSL